MYREQCEQMLGVDTLRRGRLRRSSAVARPLVRSLAHAVDRPPSLNRHSGGLGPPSSINRRRPLARAIARPLPVLPRVLFERSEFLIDTSQKKRQRVCPCARVPRARVHVCSTNNLGFSVWCYVPHTYVPGISSLSAGYQDTYM